MTDLLKMYRAYYKREISKEEFIKCNTLAYREYERCVRITERWGESHMILCELYQDGYQAIAACVKDLGFMSFYITDGFSNLIERLGTLPEYCKIDGVCKICIGTKYDFETDKEEPEYGYALHVVFEDDKI